MLKTDTANEYWVQLKSNLEKFAGVVEKLEDHCNSIDAETFEPVVGGICAAPYEGEWYTKFFNVIKT